MSVEQVDRNEAKIASFLERFGLSSKRFPKKEQRSGRTPDFRVYQGDTFRFFCEVKSIDDGWLDKQLAAAPLGTLVGGGRPDPIFNRLADDIHEAVKQFDAVNPDVVSPNVLAFVNHDNQCGVDDLISVVTGYTTALNGTKYPTHRKFSEGRIINKKQRIHLFVWLDDSGKKTLT